MDATQLAQRIHDNLNWSLMVGADSPFVAGSRESTIWSQLQSLWGLPDDQFVEGVYLVLLSRPADPTGLAANCAALAGGTPRAAVVRGLAQSDEARLVGLDLSWLPQLDAMPAPVRGLRRLLSLDAWKARFRRPASAADLGSRVAALWSEPDESFVTGLYRALLRRPPDPEGMAGFLAGLAAGMSRAAVVREMALSDEAQRRRPDVSWLSRLDPLPPGRLSPWRYLSLPRIRAVIRRLRTIRGNAAGRKTA